MNWKKLRSSLLAQWLFFSIPVLSLAFLPILSDWVKSQRFITISDLIFPLLQATIVSIIVCAIFFRTFQKNQLAGMIGALGLTLFTGQGFITRLEALLPILRALAPLSNLKEYERPFFNLALLILFTLAMFGISALIRRATERKKWKVAVPTRALMVMLVVAFILQLGAAVQVATEEWSQYFYRPVPLTIESKTPPISKPDIYYLVFDRYTNQSVLSDQFNYDNSEFIQFLEDKGFVTNPEARSNYPFTTMSIASTLNAQYNTDITKKFGAISIQTDEAYHQSIRHATVVEFLKRQGYSYHQLGSWYEATNFSPQADQNYQLEGKLTLFGNTFTLNTFARNFIALGPFGALLEKGLVLDSYPVIRYTRASQPQATQYQFETLNFLAGEPAGGRLIFAHILAPHAPFDFNADGSFSLSPDVNNIGEPIKKKYVRQVEFINASTKSLIEKIEEQSKGKAVIIIQSDEGPYPIVYNHQKFDPAEINKELDTKNMADWSQKDLQMKYGILAAYHIPDASSEAVKQFGDSVNIFRLILNTYFHGNVPYLPNCSFALTKGRAFPFVYGDVTTKITGTEIPGCSS